MDGMREGDCVYQEEIMELMGRFEAEGVVLIVIKGNRNKNETEVSIGVHAAEAGNLSKIFLALALELRARFNDFMDKAKISRDN